VSRPTHDAIDRRLSLPCALALDPITALARTITSANLLRWRGVAAFDPSAADAACFFGELTARSSTAFASSCPSSLTLARPSLVMISEWEPSPSLRRHTGMPDLVRTWRTRPFSVSVAASLQATLSLMPSGKVAAPSWRCAARDSTISCISVSLIDGDFGSVRFELVVLRVESFVMVASWRLHRGKIAPSPPQPRSSSLAGGVHSGGQRRSFQRSVTTTLLSFRDKSSPLTN
jgi:hypothetical protein